MANWWTLKVLSGPEAGKIYNLKKDRTVIGRVKGDVVFSNDGELSSIHAELTYDDHRGLLIVQDLKSRNGCKVNGERVEKRFLMPGDRIKLGSTEFVLEPPSSDETRISVGNQSVSASAVDAPPSPPAREEKAPAPETRAAPAAAATEQADTKPQGRITEMRYESRDSTQPEFHGYFARFFGVLFRPTQFFDFLLTEHSLISSGNPVLTGTIFAAVVLVLGGALTTTLSYYLMFVWEVIPIRADFGTSPMAMGLSALAQVVVLPVSAVGFHFIGLIAGGKAPFKVAFRVACYASAITFMSALASLVPKAGPILATAFLVQHCYFLAVGAIRLYYVPVRNAAAICAISAVAVVTGKFLIHQNAVQMQHDIARGHPQPNVAPDARISQEAEQDTAANTHHPAQQGNPMPTEQRDPAASEGAADQQAPVAVDQHFENDTPSPMDSGATDPEPPSLPQTYGE